MIKTWGLIVRIMSILLVILTVPFLVCSIFLMHAYSAIRDSLTLLSVSVEVICKDRTFNSVFIRRNLTKTYGPLKAIRVFKLARALARNNGKE